MSEVHITLLIIIHRQTVRPDLSGLRRRIATPDLTHAYDSPLTLCDFHTVAPEDLVTADNIFPRYQDEAYEVIYSLNQRWFKKMMMMYWDDVRI